MERLTATNSAGYVAPVGLVAAPVVFTVESDRLAVLLARRRDAPYEGRLGLPGGFVGDTESSRQTVERKLAEKTGLPPIYVEQLFTYDEPDRDERGWLPHVAYLALVPAELLPPQVDTEATWQPVAELPELPFGQSGIVEDGVERLRGKLWYSNVAVGLLPPRFTLSEARCVYEAIAGVPSDPNAFRRRLQGTGLVRATGEFRTGGVGRPAELYEFLDRVPTWGRGYGAGTVGAVGAAPG